MSRSGYSEYLEPGELNCWRGAVRQAMKGKRGQRFFRDLVAALDAMATKELHESVLVEDEKCCAMGALALSRGLDTEGIDPWDREQVGELLDIAGALAAETAYLNDNASWGETPAKRWERMRSWAEQNIDKGSG